MPLVRAITVTPDPIGHKCSVTTKCNQPERNNGIYCLYSLAMLCVMFPYVVYWPKGCHVQMLDHCRHRNPVKRSTQCNRKVSLQCVSTSSFLHYTISSLRNTRCCNERFYSFVFVFVFLFSFLLSLIFIFFRFILIFIFKFPCSKPFKEGNKGKR
ncbi:hypothetical protein GQX74_003774 [Glossina fuscipes]|nr:hypothetical protein GQX74_003774 [Glossina fuscipes]